MIKLDKGCKEEKRDSSRKGGGTTSRKGGGTTSRKGGAKIKWGKKGEGRRH